MDRRTPLMSISLAIARVSWLAGPLLLAGCDMAATPPPRAEASVSTLSAPLRASNEEAVKLYQLVETYFDDHLALNPILATQLGDHRFNDRFGDYVSMSWMADSLGIEQESLERLQAVDPKKLTGEDRITYDAFKRQRELGIAGYRYPSELLAINQVNNWPIVFAQLGSGNGAQPFRTTADYDRFLSRMDGYVAWVDQTLNNLRAGVTKGVVLPKVVVERTLPQLAAFGQLEDPQQTVFWQPLLNLPAGPTVADRRRLLQAYEEKIRTRVLPAYRRLHDYLAQEYLAQARDTVAWSSLPSGDMWYAHLVRYYTTLDLTPAEVHELGLREVARLRTRLAVLQGPLGMPGDARAAFDAMRVDLRFQHANEQSLLASYRALQERVDARLPAAFVGRTKATFEIRPMEAFRATSSDAVDYARPGYDPARPGVLYVNTSDLASRRAYFVEALYLQEAVPGRHYQTARAAEAPDLPRFRRFGADAAYREGWAAYAQTLGSELGVHGDPYSQFGALSLELLHAARLVIDTGLHAQDWPRQRAMDYLRANTALSEADIAAAVDRCIALPAQALAPKIGEMKILALRRRAEQRFGDRFDLRAFHEQVLGGGSLPVGVLDQRIDRWIEARR